MSSEVEAALDQVDDEIAATTRALAEKFLDMGYRVDELGVVLRPWLSQLSALRARHVARLEALSANAPPALQ